MGLYGANPKIDMVWNGIGESWKYQKFVVRERKDQAASSPLLLLSGSEVVGQDWNGKDSLADRRSVSARGGF